MPFVLMILGALIALLCWIYGEANDGVILRRLAMPVFCVLAVTIAVIANSLSTSFSNAMTYSGATREFVRALIHAIDRGQEAAAHQELRRFEEVSMQTYEGGAFLRWLEESTEHLNGTTIPAHSASAADDRRKTP